MKRNKDDKEMKQRLNNSYNINRLSTALPAHQKGRNEKSNKKGADENEQYAINIEKIVMKVVSLYYKIVVLLEYLLKI